jgi:hypothetical protein
VSSLDGGIETDCPERVKPNETSIDVGLHISHIIRPMSNGNPVDFMPDIVMPVWAYLNNKTRLSSTQRETKENPFQLSRACIVMLYKRLVGVPHWTTLVDRNGAVIKCH